MSGSTDHESAKSDTIFPSQQVTNRNRKDLKVITRKTNVKDHFNKLGQHASPWSDVIL
jgi:hypothetical protein